MTRTHHPLIPAGWLLGIALTGLATGYLGTRLSASATASPEPSSAPAMGPFTPSVPSALPPVETSPPMAAQQIDNPLIGENFSVNPEAVTTLGLSADQTDAVAREMAAYRLEVVKTIATNTRRFPRFDDPATGRIAYYYEGTRTNTPALVLRDRLLAHLDQPTSTNPPRPTHLDQPTSTNPPRPTHLDQPTSTNPPRPTRRRPHRHRSRFGHPRTLPPGPARHAHPHSFGKSGYPQRHHQLL